MKHGSAVHMPSTHRRQKPTQCVQSLKCASTNCAGHATCMTDQGCSRATAVDTKHTYGTIAEVKACVRLTQHQRMEVHQKGTYSVLVWLAHGLPQCMIAFKYIVPALLAPLSAWCSGIWDHTDAQQVVQSELPHQQCNSGHARAAMPTMQKLHAPLKLGGFAVVR